MPKFRGITIDYKSLLKGRASNPIQISDKEDAKKLLNALTPTELANIFPDYYKKALPDVSGFEKATSRKYGRDGGNFHDLSQIPNAGGIGKNTAIPQFRGKRQDTDMSVFNRRSKVHQAQTQKFQLPEEQKQVIRDLHSKKIPLAASDPKADYFNKLSPEALNNIGIDKVVGDPETGHVEYRAKPTQASVMSDEDIKKEASRDVSPGTEGLGNRDAIAKSVYDAFRNAGFSDKQAIALTAQVGRENDFDLKLIYGEHKDWRNSKRNLGFFSWQSGRDEKLLKFLADRGLVDKNGKIIPGQETLNAQAAFVRHEIENDPSYARTNKQFLKNPDISKEEASEILGNNYIRWDRAGKSINASEHLNKEYGYYDRVQKINQNFPGLPQNATPEQIEHYRQRKIEQEINKRINQTEEVIGKLQSPTAIPQNEMGVTPSTFGGAMSFGVGHERRGKGIINADPQKLIEAGADPLLIQSVIEGAKKAFGDPANPDTRFEVHFANAVRQGNSRSKHSIGHATDVQIYDRFEGRYVGGGRNIFENFMDNPHSYRHTQALAQARYQWLKENYPEMAERASWGGTFSSVMGFPGKKADTMHFSWGEGSGGGARGSRGHIADEIDPEMQEAIVKAGGMPTRSMRDKRNLVVGPDGKVKWVSEFSPEHPEYKNTFGRKQQQSQQPPQPQQPIPLANRTLVGAYGLQRNQMGLDNNTFPGAMKFDTPPAGTQANPTASATVDATKPSTPPSVSLSDGPQQQGLGSGVSSQDNNNSITSNAEKPDDSNIQLDAIEVNPEDKVDVEASGGTHQAEDLKNLRVFPIEKSLKQGNENAALIDVKKGEPLAAYNTKEGLSYDEKRNKVDITPVSRVKPDALRENKTSRETNVSQKQTEQKQTNQQAQANRPPYSPDRGFTENVVPTDYVVNSTLGRQIKRIGFVENGHFNHGSANFRPA